MNELELDILDLTKSYFEMMDEDISEDFQLLLIKSSIDHYKYLRNYPDSYTDEMIEADVIRYFSRRKANIAMEVIPEIYGKFGAEGLSMISDAGTQRLWPASKLFTDVVPICEVI